MKKLLFTAAFAVALLVPAANAAGVYVRVGPPRPVREVVMVRPSPRHVWVAGYHRWTGVRYDWAPGVLGDAASSARGVGAWILGTSAGRILLDCRLLAVMHQGGGAPRRWV